MGRAQGEAQSDPAQQSPPLKLPRRAWSRWRQYSYEDFVRLHIDAQGPLRDRLITSQDDFDRMLEQLLKLSPRHLAVDVEVAGMVAREFDRVIVRDDGTEEVLHDQALEGGTMRLVQLAVNEPPRKIRPQQWLIDLGTPERQEAGQTIEIRALNEILGDKTVEKIIHWADFEQEQFILRTGKPIRNIYDTCRASMSIEKRLRLMSDEERAEKGFGDWERTSSKLTDLCFRAYGFHLPKQEQLSDWGVEVLDDEQLLYAALDVATLVPIAPRLKALAVELGVEGKIRTSLYRSNKEVLERLLPRPQGDSTQAQAA